MKATPLPFEELQRKGVVLDFSASSDSSPQHHHHHHHHHQHHRRHHSLQQQEQQLQQQKWSSGETPRSKLGNFYVGSEKSSFLEIRRSPSPQPSSTLSSSLNSGGGGGGASTDTTGCAAAAGAAASGNNTPQGALAKCGMGVEDWEGVLPENSQEQSILRMIMGDIEDPSMGLSKLLQGTGGSQELEFSAGFGVLDPGFGFEPVTSTNLNIETSLHDSGSDFALGAQNLHGNNQHHNESLDEKPMIFNPQAIINHNQAQFPSNPSFFLPPGHAQMQDHHLLLPPPPKRLNPGSIEPNYSGPGTGLLDSGQDLFARRQQHQQLQLHPQQFQQRPVAAVMKQKMVNEDIVTQQLQQAIAEQLFKAVELIETGNSVLAQGILARLNHQLSPIGKPFHRAAFYVKEALQLLLHANSTNHPPAFSPFSLIYKIGAFKSFSEISPVLQFANFTCNQAFLEALEGFERVHIISFDIGYGGQWASLIQELALRNGGAPSLKITAFASPTTHDEVELTLTQENLKHFANEINVALEFEVINIEALSSTPWPLPLNVPDGEAIAVNLPIGSFSAHPSFLPLALRFVKQLSPKIVMSLDRSCDRTDVPFPQQVVHALDCHSSLLESLDAVHVNLEVLQKIEKYFLQPGIEKIIMGRHRTPERTVPWKSLFLSSGFSPLTFSNFNESQAEYLLQRTAVRGFHVEKRQHSLVLCWQRKELVSASAWRC